MFTPSSQSNEYISLNYIKDMEKQEQKQDQFKTGFKRHRRNKEN